MSCKAAVKGNNKLPREEVEELLKELMTLENPYHCPHGRPTMISMTKSELEKKIQTNRITSFTASATFICISIIIGLYILCVIFAYTLIRISIYFDFLG